MRPTVLFILYRFLKPVAELAAELVYSRMQKLDNATQSIQLRMW